MKYIRTSIGVGKRPDEKFIKNNKVLCITAEAIFEWYDILEEADTIETLCDAFIKKSKEPGNPYFEISDSTSVLERKFEAYKKSFKYYDYYGAIWVKGQNGEPILKPVAKMNEKGELELDWCHFTREELK